MTEQNSIITEKVEQLITVSTLGEQAFTHSEANYSYTETPEQLRSRIDQLNATVDQARCFASLVCDLSMDISSERATESYSQEANHD